MNILKIIESILDKLDVVFKYLTALILGSMTILIFIQVLFRYILNSPLAWSEELAKYLFIWMTFIAGYVGARQNKHIGVEAVQKALPPFAGKCLKSFCHGLCGVFFGAVVYYIIFFWGKLTVQKSPALGIPLSVVYLGMLIGCLFMAIWYILLAIKVFTDAKEVK